MNEFEEERLLPRYDASGYPVTDYTGTKFAPERQHALRCAQVDYVNGVEAVDPETGLMGKHYPTQREICEKYGLTEKLVSDQASKYGWHKRRKTAQNNQTVYLAEMKLKKRRARGDDLQDKVMTSLEALQEITEYKIWELKVRMQAELDAYAEAKVRGDSHVPDADIRTSEVEALSRTNDHISKSRDRIVQELDRRHKEMLAEMVVEPEEPKALPAAEDEAKLLEQAEALAKVIKDEARAEGVSETDVVTIMQMVLENERLNQSNAERARRTIQGELEGAPELEAAPDDDDTE